MLQLFDFGRVLIDQMIPFDGDAPRVWDIVFLSVGLERRMRVGGTSSYEWFDGGRKIGRTSLTVFLVLTLKANGRYPICLFRAKQQWGLRPGYQEGLPCFGDPPCR